MTAGNERSLLLNPSTVEEAAGANRTLLRDSYALRFAGERRENNTNIAPRKKKEKNPPALLKNQSLRDGGGPFSWPTVCDPLLSQGFKGGDERWLRFVASLRGITYHT